MAKDEYLTKTEFFEYMEKFRAELYGELGKLAPRSELERTREELHSRMDRMEYRMDRRFDAVDERMTKMHLELKQDILTLNQTVYDECVLGHRDLRGRIERLEGEVAEIKRRLP